MPPDRSWYGSDLIIRGPGGFTGGTVCDALVSHVDLYPTICEVAGITAPTHLQGVSLLPLVRDPAAVVRDELFAEVNYHAAYDPGRAVRTDCWKLIIHYDEEMTTPVLANCDDSEAKSVWLEHGWAQRPVAAERLYDVIFDPNESCNLAADPGHAMVLEEMRVRLHRWMEATDDPLLEGPVAAPKGARINDKHGGSPRDAPGVVE